MGTTVKSIDSFHDTKRGKLTFGIVELLLAWALGLWAVDTGSLWQYALVILFFVGGIHNLVNALHMNNQSYGKKSKR